MTRRRWCRVCTTGRSTNASHAGAVQSNRSAASARVPHYIVSSRDVRKISKYARCRFHNRGGAHTPIAQYRNGPSLAESINARLQRLPADTPEAPHTPRGRPSRLVLYGTPTARASAQRLPRAQHTVLEIHSASSAQAHGTRARTQKAPRHQHARHHHHHPLHTPKYPRPQPDGSLAAAAAAHRPPCMPTPHLHPPLPRRPLSRWSASPHGRRFLPCL